MASKKFVTVKCEAKDVFDGGLKPKVLKQATETIEKAIDGSSKLTTKTKSDEGFLLTASLTLKADDKKKPTELELKVGVTVVAVGSTAKAFNGTANGKADGFGARVEAGAKDLVDGVLEGFLPKVVKTMENL